MFNFSYFQQKKTLFDIQHDNKRIFHLFQKRNNEKFFRIKLATIAFLFFIIIFAKT